MVKGKENIKNRNTETKEVGKLDKYDAYSRAPYIVHFRSNTAKGNDGRKKAIPIIVAAKKLASSNIKIEHIDRYSFNTWKVTFQSKTLANATLTNRLIQEMNLEAFIPRYKLSRKGVIRGISEDLPLEELKTTIEEKHSNLMIIFFA